MQQMFQCGRCGAQNYIGQGYCWNCRERFEYNCPYCRVAVDPSMQYCSYCRALLPWPVQQQPPGGSYPPYQPQGPGGYGQAGQGYQPVQGAAGYGQYGRNNQYGQIAVEPPRKRGWLVGMAAVIAVLAIAVVVVTMLDLVKMPWSPQQQAKPPQIQQSAPNSTFDNTFNRR